MRECWAKNHDLREEKWHFLKISNCYCVFELRFEIRSLKLPLTPNSSLIHPKNKETIRTFHFPSCHDIKMMIITSYVRIRDDIINFFNFTRYLPIVYSYQILASSDLNQKKILRNCLFDHVFSQALPH